MNDSSATRRDIRIRRRSLSPAEQKRNGEAICRHLLSWPVFLKTESIAVYFNSDGEVDLSPVVEHAWSMGKKVYLPMLHPFAGNRLWFGAWDRDQRLIPNRYNIPEPDPRVSKPLHGLRLDMVMMQLVAFDLRCSRIGMGGGFYDRTFAFRLRNKNWRRPKLIGIAHDLQRIQRLERNAWDVQMDAVVTERKRYQCIE